MAKKKKISLFVSEDVISILEQIPKGRRSFFFETALAGFLKTKDGKNLFELLSEPDMEKNIKTVKATNKVKPNKTTKKKPVIDDDIPVLDADSFDVEVLDGDEEYIEKESDYKVLDKDMLLKNKDFI